MVVAVMAVLAGSDGPAAIARWTAMKEGFLVGVLDLPEGVPSRDVFRRVLTALRPEAFRSCFSLWLDSPLAEAVAAAGAEQPVIAIDGKTSRRIHDRKKRLGALRSVTAWASEFGASSGQAASAERSSEITAIPDWVFDVTYREDESRIRESTLRETFSWLDRFTPPLLKQHPDRTSIAMKRRSCGWIDDDLTTTL